MPGIDNTTTTTPQTPAPAAQPAAATWESVYNGLDESARAVIDAQLKAATHKANQEAQSLRGRAKGSEELVAKLKARFEVEELDDAFLDNLQRLPAEKMTAEERLKALERKHAEALKERDQYREQLTSTSKKVAEKSRDEAVLSALGKLGVRPDALEAARKLAALDASQNEEGVWTFDGKELEAYLQDFAKAHSYLLANPVAPGPGIRAQTGKPGSTLDLAHFASQPKEWQRAHVDEYLAAMKARKGGV